MKNLSYLILFLLFLSSCKNEWKEIESSHLDNERAKSFLPDEYFTNYDIIFSTPDSSHELSIVEETVIKKVNRFDYTVSRLSINAFERTVFFGVNKFKIETEVYYDTPTTSIQKLIFKRSLTFQNNPKTEIIVTENGPEAGDNTKFKSEINIGGQIYNDVYYSTDEGSKVFVNEEFGVIAYQEEFDTIRLIRF